jgi:hypothetical protein
MCAVLAMLPEKKKEKGNAMPHFVAASVGRWLIELTKTVELVGDWIWT